MKKKLNQGFTLLEILVTLGVVSGALIALFGLGSLNIFSSSASRDTFLASNLAQEAVEIVVNLRTANWLKFPNDFSLWRSGISDGQYIVDYNSQNLMAFSDLPLKVNHNGLYNYQNGISTNFRRKIEISTVDSNQFKIKVEVSTGQKGVPIFVLEDRIYNWK